MTLPDYNDTLAHRAGMEPARCELCDDFMEALAEYGRQVGWVCERCAAAQEAMENDTGDEEK